MTNPEKVKKNLSENKHSPLPWVQRTDNPIRHTGSVPIPEHVIYGHKDNKGNQRLVASTWFDDEEAKANADLIIRAVNSYKTNIDLLKKLNTLIFTMLEGYTPTVVQYNQILNEIQKVLPDAERK